MGIILNLNVNQIGCGLNTAAYFFVILELKINKIPIKESKNCELLETDFLR